MNYSNLIPWSISFLSLLITALTFARNGKKDTKEDIQRDEARFDGIKEGLVKANVKLDTVCNTTNETRTDIKALNKDLVDIEKRVSIIERDMKTVFTDIEELKGKVEA